VNVVVGHHINGPWDSTLFEPAGTNLAILFVTNVLNGDVTRGDSHVVNKGTVVRLVFDTSYVDYPYPVLKESMVIGYGFGEKTDPAALIVGPTGVALRGRDLFVCDTLYSRISRIPNALNRLDTAFTGIDVSANGLLNGPLGLLFSPVFQIVAANGGDGLLVKVSPDGNQLGSIDTGTGPGGLFGIALGLDGNEIFFVNNVNNTLQKVVP